MLEYLDKLDQQLFLFLNDLNTPFFDPVFWFISARFTWVPFYLILVGILIKNFKKDSVITLIAIGILIVIADRFTSGFMKPFFERLRPCHNPEISVSVHLINGWCGGKYGFVSSHAANTFALATYFFLIFKQIYRHIWLMFLWASIVAYSRVYAGVHYPGDVIAGALIGTFLGFLIFKATLLYMNRSNAAALEKIKPLH